MHYNVHAWVMIRHYWRGWWKDSREHFSTSYVLSKLDVSDDDCFDKNNFDRESDDVLGDVELDSDVDSNATEDYIPVPQTAAAAAAAASDSDPDSEHGDVDAGANRSVE